MRCKMFTNIFDEIHIDKKWFYLTQERRKYYLGNTEGFPYSFTKSKRFIPKIMLLAAVKST